MFPSNAARLLLCPPKDVDFFVNQAQDQDGLKRNFFDAIVDYAVRFNYDEIFLANEVWMVSYVLPNFDTPQYHCHAFCNLLREDGVDNKDLGLVFGLACVLILRQGHATNSINNFFCNIAKKYDLSEARNLYFALRNKNFDQQDPISLLPLILGGAHSPLVDHELINSLLPFFKKNRTRVLEFLAAANHSDPKVVASLVNQSVKKGEIDRALTKTSLFEILNNKNIYTASRSTWCNQVDF